MNESTKTLRFLTPGELLLLQGRGIDIGCGPDPVQTHVRRFDREHGDANRISCFVTEQFDYVYSSHCLEHMDDAQVALGEWWKLVRTGGHLIVIVPDEDLYEQGVFPSRFNPDHRATFTISKSRSWSPVSRNMLDLANALPGAQICKLVLQDHGYDRTLMRFGPNSRAFLPRVMRRVVRAFWGGGAGINRWDRWALRWFAVDQTFRTDALAQIMLIARKTGP
jgi:SAM-dependent methyltransferase